MTGVLELLIEVQRWIQGSLSAALSGFAASGDLTLLASMLPMGVAFGAVHALTPGHSKTVLASYLVGSRLGGLKSLAVAGALSMTHVASAVVLALIAVPLVSRALGSAGRAPSLELLSRGLLAVIGVWLILRALYRHPDHSRGHRLGLTVGMVAGLVPCPLTLYAMVLAVSRGVPEAGIVFAIAMVLGVGLTLGAVALVTVLVRGWAVQVSARHGASIALLSRGLDATAGALLLAIGAYTLWGILASPG
jgi:ABC-type nickel/cobalt efflux system permease component RcnA